MIPQMLKLLISVNIIVQMGVLRSISGQASNPDPCDPVKSCQDLGPGIKVPDPNSCNSYYLCITNGTGTVVPSDNPTDCTGLSNYFQYEQQDCVGASESSCYYQPCVNHLCPYECDPDAVSTSIIADPSSCNSYFVCVPGSDPVSTSCSDGANQYFDGTGCTSNPYSCCDGCVPYCNETFVQTMDPNDCYSYYLCESVGVPPPENSFECESGTYFEPAFGYCVDEDPENICEPRCTNSTIYPIEEIMVFL